MRDKNLYELSVYRNDNGDSEPSRCLGIWPILAVTPRITNNLDTACSIGHRYRPQAAPGLNNVAAYVGGTASELVPDGRRRHLY